MRQLYFNSAATNTHQQSNNHHTNCTKAWMALNTEDIRIQSVINQASASILDDPEITGIALGGGHVIVYVERVSKQYFKRFQHKSMAYQ